jgi:gentisate 1,2-dioxygenase
LRAIAAQADEPVDPCRGQMFEYVNPQTGGAVLPTISCQIQILPPGFEGAPFRHSASAIAFVIEGEGKTVFEDRELEWGQNDSLVIPNWARHRQINRSKRARAILFTMTDTPILTAFDFYRSEGRESGAASAPAHKLSAAE